MKPNAPLIGLFLLMFVAARILYGLETSGDRTSKSTNVERLNEYSDFGALPQGQERWKLDTKRQTPKES